MATGAAHAGEAPMQAKAASVSSIAASVASAAPHKHAAVQVSDAWIRATVKGQSGTGGFMRLVSPDGCSLVGFAASVSRTAELHEMAMEGDTMRMRPIASLALPAGQGVELKPGGHHLMLMGLKKPLKAGDVVSVTLKFKTADGKSVKQVVKVPVKQAATDASPQGSMPHGH
jgi:periplasmic copper chaperone A